MSKVASFDEPYNEAMGESHRAPLKKIGKRDQKPIWFHAWEVCHGSHLHSTITYGEIEGAKEGSSYGVR